MHNFQLKSILVYLLSDEHTYIPYARPKSGA